MKLKLICLICSAALILNGCGIGEIAEALNNKKDTATVISEVKADESKETATPSPEKSETPKERETPPKEAATLTLPSAINAPLNTYQNNFEDNGNLICIVNNPDSDEFKSFSGNAMLYDFSDFWDNGLQLDEIIFVAERDLTLSFESVYYEPGYGEFFTDRVLESTALEKGQSVIIIAYLTEGIPDFRISAFAGGDMKGEWYNSYDGSGENASDYIEAFAEISEIVNYNSAVVNMAGAAAMVTALEIDEEFYHWEAIGYALTLDGDLYSIDGAFPVPESIMASYQATMFPYINLHEFPNHPAEYISYDGFAYYMPPLLYGDFASWRCVGIDNNIGGNGCSIFIDVFSPEVFEGDGYSHYEIVFEDNKASGSTPFAYQLKDIKCLDNDKFFAAYYDFMRSDEWKKVEFGEGDSYIDEELEYVEYILVDIDANGSKELWFESKAWGSIYPHGASGIYSVDKNGEVIKIISGYETGGSIGGDRVSLVYDTFADSYAIALNGHVGGFGGTAAYYIYYKYDGSTVEGITGLMESTINDITNYSIDDEECSREEFDELSLRFSAPEYDQYIFPEN